MLGCYFFVLAFLRTIIHLEVANWGTETAAVGISFATWLIKRLQCGVAIEFFSLILNGYNIVKYLLTGTDTEHFHVKHQGKWAPPTPFSSFLSAVLIHSCQKDASCDLDRVKRKGASCCEQQRCSICKIFAIGCAPPVEQATLLERRRIWYISMQLVLHETNTDMCFEILLMGS